MPSCGTAGTPSCWRRVTQIDLESTRLGLGTAPLASDRDGPLWFGPQDRDVAVATVRAAIDAGAGFIDTAPFYGWGRAERIIADAIAGLSTRPPILTKCGTVRDPAGFREDTSPAAIRADVEASLQRLALDRLDAVQVHDPDPHTPIEATWEALMALVEEGLAGAAGLSNHSIEVMERALAVGPIDVVQQNYSLLHRVPETDGVIRWCQERDIPFLAWSPLASGFLIDGFDAATLDPDDHRRSLRWATTDVARLAGVRRALGEVAARHHTTMVAIALAWTTRQRGVHAIVGARTPGETEIFGASLPVLDRDDVRALDEAGVSPG
jgi:aryl-alcohol dehydrogenase-like predicted oxidoreductase